MTKHQLMKAFKTLDEGLERTSLASASSSFPPLWREALKSKAWFKLEQVERAVVNLTIKVVKRLKSDTPTQTILKMVERLLRWIESSFKNRIHRLTKEIEVNVVRPKIEKAFILYGTHSYGIERRIDLKSVDFIPRNSTTDRAISLNPTAMPWITFGPCRCSLANSSSSESFMNHHNREMEPFESNIAITNKSYEHSDGVAFDKINIKVLFLSSAPHPIVEELREELSKLGAKVMVLHL
jgi:hypothetical protein